MTPAIGSKVENGKRESVLVTGAAGFIGFHLAKRLIEDGVSVVGVDNLSGYYDTGLKQARLSHLGSMKGFHFEKVDISDGAAIATLFECVRPGRVFHLAAQAGVRYSIENPAVYTATNLVGFANILECCRTNSVEHLIFASSSSVYGLERPPFSTREACNHPVSYYAATKKANEGMAHSYSHLFGLPVTGLRFFTVYGPWGRPDMAMWLFADAILQGKPIQLFNHGAMRRDFTFVDDVIESVVRIAKRYPNQDPQWDPSEKRIDRSSAPWRIFNVGNNRSIELLELVESLERHLGRKATKVFMPMQPGDVEATEADVSDLENAIEFRPQVNLDEGVRCFCEWFKWWMNRGLINL